MKYKFIDLSKDHKYVLHFFQTIYAFDIDIQVSLDIAGVIFLRNLETGNISLVWPKQCFRFYFWVPLLHGPQIVKIVNIETSKNECQSISYISDRALKKKRFKIWKNSHYILWIRKSSNCFCNICFSHQITFKNCTILQPLNVFFKG